MSENKSSERVAVLCRIRDIQRGVAAFEHSFSQRYGIGLNEGMVLCSLTHAERLSSGELGELLGLTPSNISKVIAAVEKKGLVERFLGQEDRRQMYFALTPAGRALIDSICCSEVECPPILQPLLKCGAGAEDL